MQTDGADQREALTNDFLYSNGLTPLRFCDIIQLNERVNYNLLEEDDMEIRFPIIPLFFLALVIFAIIIGVNFIVRFFRKEAQSVKTNGYRISKKWYLMIISFALIMLASWIFNLGWFRVILTWIPIPLIHTIAFLFINIKSINRVSTFKELEKYIILSSVTYLLPYLLLPDFGDVGGMYFFFGLIRNDVAAKITFCIAPVLFIANLSILELERKELKKCEKQ